MEILLAIVVAAAVIFFGVLISIGNERQRKAIDGLREQVVLWAVQDLKIKREHLIQTVQVPDPLEWLNKTASKVCGYDLKLQVLDFFEEPQSLVCASSDGSATAIFSPLSPADIRRLKSKKNNRLTQSKFQSPLLSLSKDVNVYELFIFNEGYLFDLELPLVWERLTKTTLISTNRIWLYEHVN